MHFCTSKMGLNCEPPAIVPQRGDKKQAIWTFRQSDFIVKRERVYPLSVVLARSRRRERVSTYLVSPPVTAGLRVEDP